MTLRKILAALCIACAPASTLAADACAQAAVADLPGATGARVRDYRATFETCHSASGATRLAVRRFEIDGRNLLLTVDPQALTTELAEAARWTCADTTDAAQAETRLLRAVRAAGAQSFTKGPVSRNAGLFHGAGEGAYVTADLCPSHRPLDRAFLELMERQGPHTPVALSISGGWLAHHAADFDWLREQARSGALDITWVDHTYSHPYIPGLPEAQNYMLRPGADLPREIFETERLLIARGGTPSVFFRFPGLVADGALMDKLRALHLVALGADAWLVLSPPPRPGSIVLVHANGNEPAGLRLFSRLLAAGKLPQPFRRIEDAP